MQEPVRLFARRMREKAMDHLRAHNSHNSHVHRASGALIRIYKKALLSFSVTCPVSFELFVSSLTCPNCASNENEEEWHW